MFKHLLQDSYKSDHGADVQAATVEVLAPYKHVFDGFYRWECGACQHEHASRACGWPISGQAIKCDGCGKINLLVRTNCEEIDKAFGAYLGNAEREKELARLRDIEKYNDEKLASIRAEFLRRFTSSASKILDEIKS